MAANHGQANENGTRMSALWGTGGKRGEGSRNSVLWGKGGRNASFALMTTIFVALVVPWAASAHQASASKAFASGSSNLYVPAALINQAAASPQSTFNVIVQGDGTANADHVAHHVADWAAQANQQVVNAAHQADNGLNQAQNQAGNAANQLANAQQAAANAQATANAKAAKAALTGKQGDRNDAAHAAADAATKAQKVVQAQQAVSAATAAVTQAQTADTTANAGITNLSSQILNQDVTNQFSSITGISATLTGAQITKLVNDGHGGLLSITPDAPTQTSGNVDPHWSSTQLWPYESKTNGNWGRERDPNFAANVPAIAIVDSGVQSRADFGSRLIASVNLSTLPNNSPGDGRGHGTFVAGIAADGLPGMTGGAPAANLVSIDVMDDTGMGLTSDIIRSCQWILDHKTQYNIKVANFSLHSSITAPFFLDPLDRAVEQLWFNGITVVAAAGNYGTASGPSGVMFSPGDDPFVITVGAADVNGSTNPNKAFVAPWSAWGSTIDGFAKPEVSAPGRYMIGPVPTNSTLVSERPANVTSPGYMQLSGTSFAAPVVAAAAANILAAHPNFTPDQVKGALMLTAKPFAASVGAAGGVGVIQASEAVNKNNPPNPNAGLEQFLVPAGAAGSQSVSFDAASWDSAAQASASWNSVSWNSASWNDASWNSVSWNSVSWNSASWNDASWNDASWNDASWNDASWNDASREDAAEGDAAADPSAVVINPDDVAALLADPTFDPTTLPPWLLPVTPDPTTTAPAATTAPITATAPAAPATTPAPATSPVAAATPAPPATPTVVAALP